MQSISILIVEDVKDTLNLLASIFTMKFPEITLFTAINGRMALELFKEHIPDIVITDINMPEMCGIAMSKEIGEIKPDTKLIALTGDTGRSALQDAIGKGFKVDHYIYKPVRFQELFAAVEQCIGEITQHNSISGSAPYQKQSSSLCT